MCRHLSEGLNLEDATRVQLHGRTAAAVQLAALAFQLSYSFLGVEVSRAISWDREL